VSPFRRAFLLTVFLLPLAGGGAAAETMPGNAASPLAEENERAHRALKINRTLVERFEAEYATLAGAGALNAPIVRTELRNLSYKIRALKEDERRLEATLDADRKARDFLEEIVRRAEPGSEGPAAGAPTALLHEKALEAVAAQDLARAASFYEEIILADPDDDQAYLILGHVRLLRGELERAAEAFANALHIDSANAAEITPFYKNLILQDPSDAGAHANLGFACLLLGNAPDAERAFRDALEIDPENVNAAKGLELLASPEI